MRVQTITDVEDLNNKRVLVRVDFNVQIERGRILEDTRLRESLPTIHYLIGQKAKVILITHIGRPEGRIVPSLRVDPVLQRMSQLLGKKIYTLDNTKRDKAQKIIAAMNGGDVAMLENIRFFSGEEKGTPSFCKQLASLGDIFVLDGFSVAHRSSASVTGLASYLPSYAGLLLDKEIRGLDAVMKHPKKPFVVVLGGMKVETKLPVIQYLIPKVSKLFIGGTIANTYWHERGYGVGASVVDTEYGRDAVAYCMQKKVTLPIDVIVGLPNGKKKRVVKIDSEPHPVCKKGEGIFDIGPETIALFVAGMRDAKTIVWNGAMGYFEKGPYNRGTRAVAQAIADISKHGAFTVIGGGETIESMSHIKRSDDIDLVSTGGGAMLLYLSGKRLPGIFALDRKNR